MVSQMAHAKNLGEPFMAHLENLYNIPCIHPPTGENPKLLVRNSAFSLKMFQPPQKNVISVEKSHPPPSESLISPEKYLNPYYRSENALQMSGQ